MGADDGGDLAEAPRVPLIALLNGLLMWPVALVMVVAEPSHRIRRPRRIAEPKKVTEMRNRRVWE